MRKRFSRRVMKECICAGAIIQKEYCISEPCWHKKDHGYNVQAQFRGYRIDVAGRDRLAAYRLLLEEISDTDWYDKNPAPHPDSSILVL